MAIKWAVPGGDDLSSLSLSTGDVLNFDRGSSTFSAGLDYSAKGYISSVYAGRRFTGNVGTPSSYLKISVSGQVQWDAGGGNVYLDPSGATASTIVALYNTGYGTINIGGGGLVTTCYAQSGKINIAEGTDVTNLYVTGGDVVLEYDATALTAFEQSSGKSVIRRPGTGTQTWKIMGGECEIGRKTNDSTPGLALTSTTLEIGDATVRIAVDGTIAAVKFLHPNAKLDWTRVPDTLTITSVIGDPVAIAKSGIKSGAQKSIYNITLSATTVTPWGKASGLITVGQAGSPSWQ